MLAGRLNRQISIITPASTQSTVSGAPVQTWSTYIRGCWACVEPLGLRDLAKFDITAQQVAHRIIIRPSTGLNVNMRVIYNGSTYLIQSIYESADRTEILTMRMST